IITAWLGGNDAARARNRFTAAGIPSYATPEQAIRAFMYVFRFRRNQEQLMETPPSIIEEVEPDTAAVRAIVRRALEENREWLDEIESKQVLAAYHIPVVPSVRAMNAEEAAARAAEFGGPVALKLLSRDIQHKTEAGAVKLDVEPRSVLLAAQDLLDHVRQRHPEARIDGISVQPMAERRNAWEVFAGIACDPLFGPVLLFGEGGEAVEVLSDRAIGLPPLNAKLAMQMIKRTRVNRRLRGYRSRPPADRDAMAQTLVKLSQLVIDIPELVELDANPILLGPHGVVTLDARIRVR